MAKKVQKKSDPVVKKQKRSTKKPLDNLSKVEMEKLRNLFFELESHTDSMTNIIEEITLFGLKDLTISAKTTFNTIGKMFHSDTNLVISFPVSFVKKKLKY